MSYRDTFVYRLSHYVGKGWQDPEYRALLFHSDSEAAALQMAKVMSGCALTWRGVAVAEGSTEPEFLAPYATRIGLAVSDILRVAMRRGAWVKAANGALPLPGDAVLIGANGLEHILTPTHLEEVRPGVWRLDSYDGGQVNLKGQCILARTRWLQWENGTLWTYDDEVCTKRGRHVVGWADLEKMLP